MHPPTCEPVEHMFLFVRLKAYDLGLMILKGQGWAKDQWRAVYLRSFVSSIHYLEERDTEGENETQVVSATCNEDN